MIPTVEISVDKAVIELAYEGSTTEIEVKKACVEVKGAGTKGATGEAGEGYVESQVSWDYFKDAGEATKDDDLFPTLITKADYFGVTGSTRVINRNAGNNLIIDSIVDTYDFNGSHYVWTTPYLGGADLLANRPGTPSVVIT